MPAHESKLDAPRTLYKFALRNFRAHNIFQSAAALSYFSLFSLAPLVIAIVAVAGLFVSDADVQAVLIERIRDIVNDDTATLVETIIANSANEERNILSLIVAGMLVAIGATTAFAQLHTILNRVWDVAAPERFSIWRLVKARLFSFAFLVLIGTLLAASLVFNTFLASLGDFISNRFGIEILIWDLLDVVTSYGMTTILLALIYRYAPDAPVRWRDAAIGAIAASILFESSKTVVQYYVAKVSPGSAFGAAGSVVVFMLWIYVASLIVLIGAEASRVSFDYRTQR
jgi:membrane protein